MTGHPRPSPGDARSRRDVRWTGRAQRTGFTAGRTRAAGRATRAAGGSGSHQSLPHLKPRTVRAPSSPGRRPGNLYRVVVENRVDMSLLTPRNPVKVSRG